MERCQSDILYKEIEYVINHSEVERNHAIRQRQIQNLNTYGTEMVMEMISFIWL